MTKKEARDLAATLNALCTRPDKDATLGDFLTLAQAAEIAGYQDSSILRRAVSKGELRTILVANTHFTRPVWLNAYLRQLRTGKYHRGRRHVGDT